MDMNYSAMTPEALKTFQSQLANLCMYLELLHRRGAGSEDTRTLYEKCCAEYQAVEREFFARKPVAEEIAKQQLINQGNTTFQNYVASLAVGADENSSIGLDFNYPSAGRKTLYIHEPDQPFPDEITSEMNNIDQLYAEFDDAMERWLN